jgi:uncharacterized membrane protein YphA (DoxX/SURF4 family)
MNVVVWVVQVLLALAFLAAGITKVLQPRDKLKARMGWVDDFSDAQVKAIGATEIVGALGLVLPAWTGIAPILTPIAATGLAITMVLALVTHERRKEVAAALPPNGILFLLAAFVAIMRFGPYSY